MLLLVFLIYWCVVHNQVQASFADFSKNACTELYYYPIKAFSRHCYVTLNGDTPVPDIIQRSGYKLERYVVTTSDGYVLTLFRIPPEEGDNRKNKQPIFLQHGIASDSAIWVTTGSLGFILADEGYDVWLGNHRGTPNSQEHTKYKSSDPEYWNFNLDDSSANDLKASLNEVARVTGKKGSIIYVGHSRGSTIAFMFASQFPNDTKELLQGIVALSPIVYLELPSHWKLLLPAAPLIGVIFKSQFFSYQRSDFQETFKYLGITSIFYHDKIIHLFLKHFCSLMPYICKYSSSMTFGQSNNFLPDNLLTAYSNFPRPISVAEVTQYVQIYNSGNFQKFDYGKEANLRKYQQEKPPLYDLSQINVPVVLLYGKHDTLLSTEKVDKFYKQLTVSKKSMESVPIGDSNEENAYNHVDFIQGKDIKKIFYNDLLNILQSDKLTSKK
ncbi:lipase member J-like [Tenebrio molitor]|uniref:lipase member J-like n=1 Tax=Tenebrio molitor TaxID=7067 RepID=UPI0036247595